MPRNSGRPSPAEAEKSVSILAFLILDEAHT